MFEVPMSGLSTLMSHPSSLLVNVLILFAALSHFQLLVESVVG
jgi:hypothetical protein